MLSYILEGRPGLTTRHTQSMQPLMLERTTQKTVCPHGTMSVCGSEGSQVGNSCQTIAWHCSYLMNLHGLRPRLSGPNGVDETVLTNEHFPSNVLLDVEIFLPFHLRYHTSTDQSDGKCGKEGLKWLRPHPAHSCSLCCSTCNVPRLAMPCRKPVYAVCTSLCQKQKKV